MVASGSGLLSKETKYRRFKSYPIPDFIVASRATMCGTVARLSLVESFDLTACKLKCQMCGLALCITYWDAI